MPGGHEALRVLKDVSLTIERGEFVALVGPSGCGKSTLLRIAAGLIPADAGDVFIDGQEVKGSRRDTAVVFQQFNLLPWRSALGNVEFALEMRGIAKRERHERALACLAQVGLAGFEAYLPAQLSGGMQQRVGLARALSIDPDVLLLDEPFGSLDALTRERLQNDLVATRSIDDRTLFLVTHDIEEAVFLSDRVVVMSQRPGRLLSIIDIPFAHPRMDDLRYSAEFARLRSMVANTLKAHLSETSESRIEVVNPPVQF